MDILCEAVKLGEIFEVCAGKICVHTKLQEMPEDSEFIVLQPTIRGVPLRSEDDSTFRFSFFRPNGVYSFNAKMLSSYMKGEIRLCRFRQVSGIEKIQRRQCYRLSVTLDVLIEAEGDAQKYKGITTTLSEKSVQLSCIKPIPKETKLSVKIYFSETETIILRGMVYKSTAPLDKNGPYDIVILFMDNNERHITRLSRYIFKKQIIARNKK